MKMKKTIVSINWILKRGGRAADRFVDCSPFRTTTTLIYIVYRIYIRFLPFAFIEHISYTLFLSLYAYIAHKMVMHDAIIPYNCIPFLNGTTQ